MRRLAQHNRVLYVNPFSADLPGALSREAGRRIWRKLRNTLTCFRRADATLYIFSPVFLPRHGHALIDSVNNTVLRVQITQLVRTLGMHPTLVWFENPRAADALDWYPDALKLYHVSDLFTACRYTRDRAALVRRDERLTAQCDVIICVSRALFELKRRQRNAAVHYLPHGVDFPRFRAAAQDKKPLPELAGLSRPIAGYYGTLTAANDVELLEHCARSAPDISFVFAGTVTGGDYGPLRSLPNVRFLGQVPYERIPALAASFDVCLLPWKLSEWIRHCSPLKFYEYLASGRPIVSVPIPQVMFEAADLVSIASDPDEFLAAIRRELATDDASRQAARVALAARHDWDGHIQALSTLVAAHLAHGAR